MHGVRRKLRPASEAYLRLGGTMPLLEKDNALPLEFIRSPVHVLGKHSEAFRATWRLRCRSIVHISWGYTTDPLAWFNWIVLMMSPPLNPPGGSPTVTMWSFGRWIGL